MRMWTQVASAFQVLATTLDSTATTRHNPTISAFHARLCRRSKPQKVGPRRRHAQVATHPERRRQGPGSLAAQPRVHGW